MTTTPDRPGLYLDAAGEIWRVTQIGTPHPPARVSFDELIENAVTPAAEQAARSGPFTPLLPITDDRRDLLIEALAEYQSAVQELGYAEKVAAAGELWDAIEALG